MRYFVFIILSILLAVQPVRAEEKLIFSGLQNSKLGLMVQEVLQKAYQQIGIRAETNHVDIGVVDRFNGLMTVGKLGLRGIRILEPPLSAVRFYNFLHKRDCPSAGSSSG